MPEGQTKTYLGLHDPILPHVRQVDSCLASVKQSSRSSTANGTAERKQMQIVTAKGSANHSRHSFLSRIQDANGAVMQSRKRAFLHAVAAAEIRCTKLGQSNTGRSHPAGFLPYGSTLIRGRRYEWREH